MNDGTQRTALWFDGVVVIQSDGNWTYIASLGIGASQREAAIAVKLKERNVGRLDEAGLKSVADMLAENDFETLRNFPTAMRLRVDDKEAAGYQVAISFGGKRRSCILYDIVRANQARATSGTNDKKDKDATKDMIDRYQNICLRLLEVAGAKLDGASTPDTNRSQDSLKNANPTSASPRRK